jgi:Ca2+-binding RTX toxin-like protein
MFLTSRKALATIGATAVAVAAATTLFAAPAQAATAGLARVSGTTVKFNALMTKSNSLTISVSGRTVTFNDKVAIKAGKGCKAVRGDRTKVKCKTSKAPKKLLIALGDKNDKVVNNTSIYMVADGGTGNDTLIGGSGKDQLQGYTGNDKLYGRGGNDDLIGQNGADYISGAAGNDRIWGGTGNDKIYGYTGNDSISGDDGNDEVYGDNYKSSAAGNDTLIGGNGEDVLTGGNGNDKLYGSNHDDLLYGAYFDLTKFVPIGAAAPDYLSGGANGTRGDYCLTLGGATYSGCETTWTAATTSSLNSKATHPQIPAELQKRLAATPRS